MPKIKVFLVDDHPVVREGIKRILQTMSQNISVVGEASNGKEVLIKAPQCRADIYLMGIMMPFLNGLVTAEKLLQWDPSCKIILLTRQSSKSFVERALKAGVHGYLTKECNIEDIPKAINAVSLDRYFLCPPIQKYVVDDFRKYKCNMNCNAKSETLTIREKEILQLIGEGIAKKQIANKLNVSINTVLVHNKNIMQKLNMHRQAELIRYSIKEGLAML